MSWIDNEELFTKECKEGHKWERYVAHFLSLHGLSVRVGKQTIRESIDEINEYENEPDLVCQGFVLEVKSRKEAFTSPDHFPYPTIFVDEVEGWNKKDPKPEAVICVSRQTGSMIAIPQVSEPHWEVSQRTFDRTRKSVCDYYEADKELWVGVDKLVQFLKE